MEDRKKRIGRNIKKIRTERGLTQHQIADKMNIHRSTYTYYEIGKCDISAAKLLELCEILNTDPNTLLDF